MPFTAGHVAGGVATSAVLLVCKYIADEDIGDRAIIRADPLNTASVRVAESSGFRFITEITSTSDHHADGSPVVYVTYALILRDSATAGEGPPTGARGDI
ncbi:GNAT family N-acetyltransferase [Arthrobacter sp. ISL-30]|uniref:GNAT family N-acetyltransferase n=1 Tax=Arthrobacter sp. ISL-30 TaxID=2819109 RepID=UPI001BE9B684|nr:GNAT family N-acetyltransferase [Arthrobacter sp. ISL-30]